MERCDQRRPRPSQKNPKNNHHHLTCPFHKQLLQQASSTWLELAGEALDVTVDLRLLLPNSHAILLPSSPAPAPHLGWYKKKKRDEGALDLSSSRSLPLSCLLPFPFAFFFVLRLQSKRSQVHALVFVSFSSFSSSLLPTSHSSPAPFYFFSAPPSFLRLMMNRTHHPYPCCDL